MLAPQAESLNRLVEHGGIAILVELGGVRRTGRRLLSHSFKRKNVVLLDEVERWDADGMELRITRPVLRRVHWVLGPWRLD